MKINIYFKLKNGAWGGGNQFLKAIREYLISINVYEEDYTKADVILFNSHQYLDDILKIKLKYPNKIFLHRIDGPMVHYRGGSDRIDLFLFIINNVLADGTIFQSNYSKNACFDLGLKNNTYETTIINAPNSKIFNFKDRTIFDKNKKIKLIATSWSSNIRKGFEVYKWLDENLDFTKYEMKFIGNSPVKFTNLKHIEPLASENLSNELKNSDIFITASQKDPCSNSLIEAIHSGLPTIVLNDGGHPEIISNAGLTFNKPEEIPQLLHNIVDNYEDYVCNIDLPNIDDVGKLYFNFCEKIYEDRTYITKRISSYYYYKTIIMMCCEKVKNKLKYMIGLK